MHGGEFELIYEGPSDDSSETLRRIKSTFVGDLNFSIEETKEFLEKTPATLFTADDEHSLDEYYHILKKAGARVYIVRPRKAKKDTHEEIEVAFDFGEEEIKPTKVFEVSDDSSLDDELPIYDLASEDEVEAPPINEKAFHLHDEESSLENLLDELSDDDPSIPTIEIPSEKEPVVTEEAPLKAAPPVLPQASFKLELESNTDTIEQPTPEPVKAPVETPKEETKTDVLQFSFESSENTSPKQPEVKVEASPKLTPPPNLTSLDLTFDEEPHAPPVKEEVAAVQEQKEKSWDLSFDEPAAPPPPPKKQVQTTVEEVSLEAVEPEAPKNEKVGNVDDILNSYEPEKPEPKKSNEPAVIPPVAEVLASRRSETTKKDPQEAAPKKQAKVSETPAKSSPDLLYGALIGVLILWGGNHWYFSKYAKQAPETSVESETLKIKPKAIDEPAPPSDKHTWSGKGTLEQGEVEASVLERNGKIIQLSIRLKGFETAALTPEQIVNGYKRKPWIEQLHFDPGTLETSPEGEVSATGPARISVNDDKEIKRFIGTAASKVKLVDGKLTVHLEAWYGAQGAIPGITVKRTENGIMVATSIDTEISLEQK